VARVIVSWLAAMAVLVALPGNLNLKAFKVEAALVVSFYKATARVPLQLSATHWLRL